MTEPSDKSRGAGRGRHPNSLANLRRGGEGRPAGDEHRPALRHGAFAAISREHLDAEAQKVLDAISADAPLRDSTGGLPAADGVIVRLLAAALIRLQRVESYITEHGFLTDDGEQRPVLETEGRLRREIADHCEALAMTPRSRSRIGVELVRAANEADEAEARAARERLDARWAAIEGDAEEAADDGA